MTKNHVQPPDALDEEPCSLSFGDLGSARIAEEVVTAMMLVCDFISFWLIFLNLCELISELVKYEKGNRKWDLLV